MKRLFTSLVAAVALLLCACGGQAQESPWQTAYRETGQYLLSQPAPTTGSIGGEWAVIGLRRAGLLTDEMARSYKAAAEDYVRQAGSPRLHRAKSTDTSRTILGLTAAGYDATAVAGIDLTAGLSDMSYLRIQGLNGPIWALIALDCGGYAIPQAAEGEEQTTREGLVSEILSAQCPDGGWTLLGEASDVDMTAMALTSLSPYLENRDVQAAVERALTCLSRVQQDNGGFMSWGTVNSESCAQVIVALTSLGIDPAADSRFIKNGASPLDGLCAFACVGGGFRHSDELPEPPAVAPTVTKQTAPVTAAARQSHPNSVTASQVNPDRTAAKQVASDGAIVVPIEPDGMAIPNPTMFLSLRTRPRCSCHCEPVTDVTGVAIRVPRPRAAGADTLLFRASPQAGVGIRSLNSSSFIEPPPSGGGLLRVASGGVLLSPATKVPKTPLETTFQDFLSALCPVSNLPHVPRVIGFPVYRCRSKGLCHHSFPLPLRCRCLLPR